MALTVAFKVDRIGFYRLFGPLVDEALRSGARVILLHRDLSADRVGTKAYQWADPALVPAFLHGRAEVVQWRGDRELVEVCVRERVDALVTIWTYFDPAPCEALRDSGVTWVALQESHEFHLFPVEMLLRPDLMCMFSEWWIDLVEAYYPGADRGRIRATLRATGWPELDAFDLVSRTAVRERLGLGERPVVTLATYKQHADDVWERLVFRSSGTAAALARTLVRGRADLIGPALRGITYDRLLRAVRRACDRAGAAFVSKARGKDRPPALERELAGVALMDTSYYPATVVELAAITQVFVNFLSTATLEAVFGGAAVVCPMPPAISGWMRSPASARFRELIGWRAPGSLWSFPGVVEQLPIEAFIESFPDRAIDAMRPSEAARAAYVDRFLGGPGPHAPRTWGAIVEVTERRRAARTAAGATR